MISRERPTSILVIPCSGIGKVHGLISREAAYVVTDQLAPGHADTLCLALLMMGDAETVSAVRTRTCITVDGCPKACARKNVELAGGRVAKAVQVVEAFKGFPGAKPGTASALTEEGWAIARAVAEDAMRLAGGMDDSGEGR